MSEPRVGVALTKCYYCNKNDKIVLNSLLTEHMAKKVEKMQGCVIDMEPCNECRKLMDMGIILITIDDAKSGEGWNKPPPEERYTQEPSWKWDKPKRSHWMPNPYRTGGFFVLKDEAIRRIIQPQEMADYALKHRWMFIEHEAAEKLGLFQTVNENNETKGQ